MADTMNDTVLVVDDIEDYVEMHTCVLEDNGLTVVAAQTLEELDELYDEFREELAGIILDGCVPGDDVNTYPFIKRVKADMDAGDFTGILMAASSASSYRARMVAAGCTHEAPKDEAASRLLDLLTS